MAIEQTVTEAHHHGEYHALYWHLGPFGRQDVHLHPCITHPHCHFEKVGRGRECTKGEPHAVKSLSIGKNTWQDTVHEGTDIWSGG